MMILLRTVCGCSRLTEIPSRNHGHDLVVPHMGRTKSTALMSEAEALTYTPTPKRTFRYYGHRGEFAGAWFPLYEEVYE